MVFVGNGRTEKSHHAIAQKLVDRPLVPVDLVQEESETPVHNLVNRLRIKLLEHSGGIRHIREHNGNDFVFTLDGTARGKDFVGKILRSVGMRPVEVQRFGFSGSAEIMAALITKLAFGGTGLPALRACQIHFAPAFVTEPCPVWLLSFTFPALHRNALFDFFEEEFLRSWKGDANNPVIQTCNNYSTVLGVEPEFVAFNKPRKGNLVVTHLPDSSPRFFQFQSGFTVVRGILDFGNIGPNVLGPWTATGRGGEKKEKG
jgi:hypothetical protein